MSLNVFLIRRKLLRKTFLLALFLAGVMFLPRAGAEPPMKVVDRGEYRMARTGDLLVTSKAGRDYRLLIGLPEGEPPEGGFPVLYVLDANSCFGTVVEAQRMQVRRGQTTGITPAVIVGIGYPGDSPFDSSRRTFDLTTPGQSDKLPKRPDGSPWPPSGGADEFLAFVEDEVKPLVETRTKINRSRQSIFGHSFGGLFVLHAMFTRPESFQTYIAASPSVWWNDFALQSEEQAFAQRCAEAPVDVRLRLTTAELEKNTGPAARLQPTTAAKTFGTTADLAARLSALASGGVKSEYEEFPNENHGSVLPVALNRGLRFALPGESHADGAPRPRRD